MDGFGPIALSQQVGAALHAEQGTILERPIDQAVAPGVSAAQQIAELAFAEDMIGQTRRSEEHTSELQSLMRISYAVFCLKKKQHNKHTHQHTTTTHHSPVP